MNLLIAAASVVAFIALWFVLVVAFFYVLSAFMEWRGVRQYETESPLPYDWEDEA